MTTPEPVVLLERRGRVAVITLNRPRALNALNAQLLNEVVSAATAFDAGPEIGAIVVTGSERAFAAGADIKEMAGRTFVDVSGEQWLSGWDCFAALRTPTVAAVSGLALGGAASSR